MSFRMDVKVEKVLEDGAYDAKLVNVEDVNSADHQLYLQRF